MRLYQNLLLSKTTKLKAHDVLLTNSSASWWTSSNEADDSSNKINNISLTTAFATVNKYVHRNKATANSNLHMDRLTHSISTCMNV